MRTAWRVWFVALVLSAGSCKQENEDFCDADHPCTDPARPYCDLDGAYPASDGIGLTCIPDPGGGAACDGDGACTDPLFPVCELEQCRECRDATQCDAAAPVCGADFGCGGCAAPADCAGYPDTPICGAAGACVECAGREDCGGTTPVCGAAGACEACTAHGQCDSGLCDMGTGACVAETDIAYVTAGGTAVDGCAKATPCGSVQAGIDRALPYVLVGPGAYAENLTADAVTTTIVGEGATLRADAPSQAALLVRDGSVVTIEGLTVRGGHDDQNGDGIRCSTTTTAATVVLRNAIVTANSGQGVDVSECNLVVERSTISLNTGGGLQATSSTVTVRNSFLVANGGVNSTSGGVFLVSPTSASVIEFSTIAGNIGGAGADYLGIFCSAVATPLTFRGVIVWGEGAQVHSTGNCSSFQYSNLAGIPAAGTNISTAPLFADVIMSDYHLAPGSAGIDQGGTTGVPAIDFDGDPRPQGSAADMGADETTP